MADRSRQIDQTWMPSVSLLGIMNGDVSDVERLALAVIVEQNPSETEKLHEALNVLLAKIADERKQLLTLIKGNSEAEKLYEQFSTNYDAYLEKMPAFVEYGLKNDYNNASTLHTAAYPLWYTANDTITQLINLGNNGSKEISAESVKLAENSFKIILGVAIVATLLALFIAFSLQV